MSRRRRFRRPLTTETALVFFLNACAVAVLAITLAQIAPVFGWFK